MFPKAFNEPPTTSGEGGGLGGKIFDLKEGYPRVLKAGVSRRKIPFPLFVGLEVSNCVKLENLLGT